VLSYVRRHVESLTASHAQRFNTLTLSNLELLVQYGPSYLTRAEYEEQLRRQLEEYYDSLAKALYLSGEKRRIWQHHSERSLALGRRLSKTQLARAYLRALLSRGARR